MESKKFSNLSQPKNPSIVDLSNIFIKDANLNLQRKLIKSQYQSKKTYWKRTTKNELKKTFVSLFFQKIRFKKDKKHFELYSQDLRNFKKLWKEYQSNKKHARHEYRKQLKQAKFNAKIAKYEFKRKNVFIDSQDTLHKPLLLEKKECNEAFYTNSLYKAKLKKEKYNLHIEVGKKKSMLLNTYPNIDHWTIRRIKNIYFNIGLNEAKIAIIKSFDKKTAFMIKELNIATLLLEKQQTLLESFLNALKNNKNLTDMKDFFDKDFLFKEKIKQINDDYKKALEKEKIQKEIQKKDWGLTHKNKENIKKNISTLLNSQLKKVNKMAKIKWLDLYQNHPYIPKQYFSILKNILIHIEKNKVIANCCAKEANSNYDTLLKYKEAKSNIKGGEDTLQELLIVLKQRHDDISKLKKLQLSFTNSHKKALDKRILELKNKKIENIKQIKTSLHKGLISKNAYKKKKKRLNKDFLYEKLLIQLENPSIALPKTIKYYNALAQSTYKAMNQIRLSNLSDVRLTTPINVTKEKKYLLTILAVFLPGLPQILLKQYRKGLIMFFSSISILVFSWLVVLGVISYQGRGIVGLALGHQTMSANLTASYLIEGVISLILLVIIFSIMLGSVTHTWRMTKSIESGARPYDWVKTKLGLQQASIPYTLGLPATILTIFIVVVPIIASFFILFTNFDADTKFGVAEMPLKYDTTYLAELFSGKFSQTFADVLGWTIIWTFGSTTLVVFLGVVMALLVNNKKVRFKGFWRIIYLLPWAIPAFVTILFFKVANSPGGELSLLFSDWFGFKDGDLLRETDLVRIWLIFMQGWLGHSYIFLLITSGLQSISNDLYEAAKMDGASSWQQLWRITTPIVLYQVAPLMVGQFAFNFGNFTAIYLYSGGGPTPLGSTLALGLGQTDILATVTFKLIQGSDSKEALAGAFTFFGSLIVIVPTAIALFRTRVFRRGRL